MKERKRFHRLSMFLMAVFMLAGILVFGNQREVSAAAKKETTIQVKVDSKYKAVLVKKKDGWYLQSAEANMSKRKAAQRVAYLTIPKKKELASGYYYFNKYGRIDSRKAFHQLNVTVKGIKFNGKYYFGESGGRLRMKSGWVTYKGKKYALNKKGRMYTDRWYGGYYLKANGQIAKSMQLPDGTYVDSDGKRCAKEEVRLSGLKNTLKTMINGYSGSWSVYVKDLKTGDVLSINDTAMYPASVIKLFVMEATYDRIKSGKLSLNSGISSLLNQMITVSDNESYNELVRRNGGGSFITGCSNINAYLKKSGYTKTGVHYTLSPSSSPSMGDGGSNSSSASDAGKLLEKIYKRKAVSKKYSDQMLKLLLNQTRRWKIPSGLPSGTKVANKTGETDNYQHDAAIVYGKKTDYVVVIFSNATEYNGINGIKQLSSKIYSYLN